MSLMMGGRPCSALSVTDLRFIAASLALAVLAACAPPPPADRLPAGTLLLGRGAGFSTFLSQCRELAGTPLARAAEVAQTRIADCDEFSAFCPAGEECSLLDRLACGAGGAELAPARELLGAGHWLMSSSLADGRATIVGRSLADGGQRLEANLTFDSASATGAGAGRGGLSLLLPAAAGPGPPRMSGDDSLLHLRIRPDGGLDVASLIPAEGMAARLFRLKSELFLATTLAGEWELAVYSARPGQLIPPVALALDVVRRDRAVTAMESFLAQIGENWPVERVPYEAAGHSGACLSALHVMPDLAPCYVATDDALVVGWNPVSIDLALRPPRPSSGAGTAADAAGRGSAEASTLVVDLERFPETDRLLAAGSGVAQPVAPSKYPWRALRVTGRRNGDGYRFEGELLAW
jgi:hypothetical protein